MFRFVALGSCLRRNTVGSPDATRLRLSDGEQAKRHALPRVDEQFACLDVSDRNKLIDGFSKEHDCTLLVWYEASDDIQAARQRELQMKKWKRAWKIELIERDSPRWKDWYETLF